MIHNFAMITHRVLFFSKWPREAAAKARRIKIFAEEDAAFRLKLRGLDTSGNTIGRDAKLVGMPIDAMDSLGRWYPTKVLEISSAIQHTQDVAASMNITVSDSTCTGGQNSCDEVTAVRVDFSLYGGNDVWLPVNSDRIAVAGRFTRGSGESDGSEDEEHWKFSKARPKKGANGSANSDINGSKAVCMFPKFGACGLNNLGNACYANSALQCLSYMPLLRSYLVSDQYKISGDLNQVNPLGTKGVLVTAFADLLKQMWSCKFGVLSPSRFKTVLSKARPQYAGGDQQDAQV